MLTSANIFLRKLNRSDADFILAIENDPENWKVSGTVEPFTKGEIADFVTQPQDLYEQQQVRYVICLSSDEKPIGTIDLFEFNASNKIVGVGILIADLSARKKGFATEALGLISEYCRNELNVVTIFCNIFKDNMLSIRLFEKNGFQFIEERELFEKPVNYYELKL